MPFKFNPLTGKFDLVQDLSGYVPYTGATSDVDLGSHGIIADTLGLNTSYTPLGTESTGTIYWDTVNRTYSAVLENGVVGQLFKEAFIDGQNDTGSTITDGSVVAYQGSIGNSGNFRIKLAQASSTEPAFYNIGIVTADIANGDRGEITVRGKVRGIQTNGANYGETWSAGDIVYLSSTIPGGLTKVPPSAPTPAIPVALVISAHATNGTLEVRPTFPQKFTELSDVNGTPLTTDGQIPVWDNTNSYFDFTKNINDYLTTTTAASTYVPYTGANANVDLGAYSITASNLSGTNTGDQVSSDFDHGGLTGLSDDDHTQYALLAGRGTSQTLYGGTNTTGVLALQGSSSPDTSNSTYGLILKNGVRNMIAISNNSIINFGGKVQSSYNNAFAGTTLFENALYIRDSVSTGSGTQTYVYGWLASGYRPLLAGDYSTGKVQYLAEGGTQGHELRTLNRSSDFTHNPTAGYGLTLNTTDPNSNGQHRVGIRTLFNGTGTYDVLNLVLTDTASNADSNYVAIYSAATYAGTPSVKWRIRKDLKLFGQASQWDVDSAQQYGMQVNHTWNNSGTAYHGLELNITNTASSLSSEAFGINIDGSSVFYLNRTGNIYATGNFLTNGNVEGYNFTVNGALTLNNPILLNGGMKSLVITKTADFNFFDSYYTTEVDTSSAGADVTGTLQASPMTGIIMYITLIDATHNLIIDGNGNNIIDSTGSHTSITLSSFGTAMIQFNGTNWIRKY